jgi:uncharacterized small protein (DUF1192 family)
MLTKTGLRGTAAGVFMTTAVFAGIYYTGGAGSAPESAEASEEMSSETAFSILKDHEEFSVYRAGEEPDTQETNDQTGSLEEKEEQITQLQNEVAGLTAELEESESERSPAEDSEVIYQTTLVVSSGMTFGNIAGILKRSQVIESRSEFNDYINDNNLEMSLRQGEFILDSTMSIPEIADKLTS